MSNDATTIKLSVPGMTCGHCESAVKEEVGKLAAVESIDVNLDSKIVTVSGTGLDRGALVEAIDEAGFDVDDGE